MGPYKANHIVLVRHELAPSCMVLMILGLHTDSPHATLRVYMAKSVCPKSLAEKGKAAFNPVML